MFTLKTSITSFFFRALILTAITAGALLSTAPAFGWQASGAADASVVFLEYEMSSNGLIWGDSIIKRSIIIKNNQRFMLEETDTNTMTTPAETVDSKETFLLDADQNIVEYTALHINNTDTTRVAAEVMGRDLVVRGSETGAQLHDWMRVNRGHYHFTSLYMPIGRLDLSEETSVKRFIDFGDDHFTIHENKMTLVGRETVRMGEISFDCQIITIDFGHIKGRLWIAKDKWGYFLIKEEANLEGTGPFEITLVQYRRSAQ